MTSADIWLNTGRLMNQFDRAAQQYFDPPDPKPTCDICDEPWDRPDDPEPWLDWNEETGNHITCEERQIDEEDDGLVLIAGVLYDAETLEEAEPFRPECLHCGGPCEKVEQHWRSDFGHPQEEGDAV